MSFERLLLSSSERKFVYKIWNEIYENSISIANDIYNKGPLNLSFNKIHKDTFMSLVDENEKLLENEKEYCKQRFIYDRELQYARYKIGSRPRRCKNCY